MLSGCSSFAKTQVLEIEANLECANSFSNHPVLSASLPGLPLTHLSSLCLCPSAKRRWSKKSGTAACDATKANSSELFKLLQSKLGQAGGNKCSHPKLPWFQSILCPPVDIGDILPRLLLPGMFAGTSIWLYIPSATNAATHERQRRATFG